MSQVASGGRPEIADLLAEGFDAPRGLPAAKTLIICAAPRTGSFELARLLTAAGIGVAHEYFNPNFAAPLAARWGLAPLSLSESEIDRYIDELRRRRARGDVFATKLQYWQFHDCLRNQAGRKLFEGAVVVHLYRADPVSQFVSLHLACETGQFDFSDRVHHPPRSRATLYEADGLLALIDELMIQDGDFRRLFITEGIRPIFVEFERLVADPRPVVEEIAAALGVPVDAGGLERAIGESAPYGRRAAEDDRERRLREILRGRGFKR